MSPEEEDEEEKELWEERLRILEEVQQLKQVATFFLRPELPVTTQYGATASAIFDRWSVSEPLPEMEEMQEEEEERQSTLADLTALSRQAKVYLHPEAPVQVDPACFGRNYFARISAEPYEEEETDADRDDVLEDVQALKSSARLFSHPEDPVAIDATACGRNYFGRASAEPQGGVEDDLERDFVVQDLQALQDAARQYLHPEASVPRTSACVAKSQYAYPEDAVDERACILRDARLLKESAVVYLHPEASVTVDPACCGRNYFARVSAEPYEDEDVDADHDDVLEDVQALKEMARRYSHPEDPVQVDAAATARNYFSRASAPESVDVEDDLERDYLVQDLQALQEAARQYLHPEVPLPRTSAAVTKSHAYHEEEVEEAERTRILRDARLLKASSQMYLHPEAPVTIDPACRGRNYFARVSAEPYEDEEVDADRDNVLEDVQALNESARHFSHPEEPVQVDATATARNYFGRFSAPEWQDVEDDLERDYLVEDLQSLKAAARQYLHPEDPVQADSVATARNYFSRPSAEEPEDVEQDLDRDFVLGDVQALRMSAQAYLHPEVNVRSSAAVGRTHSYDNVADEEASDDRAAILRDLQLLKTSATHFLHPEAPVVVDPEVCGRNYFARPSADLYESDDQVLEREQAIRDARALESLAAQYAHPEAALAVDPTALARSYFGRYAAPQPEDHSEEEAERELVLADALALKKLAVDFRHPEATLVGAVSGGRNYFNRPSAHGHDQMIHTFPAHEDDWHHDDDDDYYGHHHEHLDHFGMDEEMEARFEDLRQNLPKVAASSSSSANKTAKNRAAAADGSDEEGGNLSRSPSSVMLFTDESIYD